MSNMTKAHFYLLLMTLFWGITFPLIKNAIDHIDAYSFVAVRFTLAALLLLPFILKEFKKTNVSLIKGGIILGILNSGAYTFQTAGLQYLDSARSAFITGSSVLFVPFLAHLFKLGHLRITDIIYGILCLIGLYILTGANLNDIDTGEILTFLCAICVALSIVYLQSISRTQANYKLLCFYQILFTIPVPLLFSFSNFHLSSFTKVDVIIALLFCTMIATVWGMYLQAKYQKYTTANKAALIFTLEPVFASIFGVLINGENITWQLIVGGGLILFSVIFPELNLTRAHSGKKTY